MCGNCSETTKTYSRTVTFETGGNSHARLLWQSRWKIRSAIQPLPHNPHPHLQARRFRFVRTLRNTTVAHQEEAESGRSIVSRLNPPLDLCTKTNQRVQAKRESRTTYRVISHLAQKSDALFGSSSAPSHCGPEATRLPRFLRNPASFAVVPPPDTIGLCTPDGSDTAVFLWEAKFLGDDETE